MTITQLAASLRWIDGPPDRYPDRSMAVRMRDNSIVIVGDVNLTFSGCNCCEDLFPLKQGIAYAYLWNIDRVERDLACEVAG